MFGRNLLLAAFICGAVWAQSEPSLRDAMNSLPPELQGKVDENQIHDIKNKSTVIFKEKCEKNGGPEAFTNAENSFKGFTGCLESLVNTTVLQREIEDAKPTGQVDEVFKKYCAKTPQFKGCFRDMTEAAKPCFTPDERNNLKTVYNVSEQLAEFICFKEGDRIALFIAEGGPECIQEKGEEIQSCLNSTVGSNYNITPNNFSVDSIPEISFGEKECKQMQNLQKCVVSSLETCSQPTSANIVESLFNFIRKATPCKKYDNPVEAKKPNSASGLAVTSLTVIMVMTTALFA